MEIHLVHEQNFVPNSGVEVGCYELLEVTGVPTSIFYPSTYNSLFGYCKDQGDISPPAPWYFHDTWCPLWSPPVLLFHGVEVETTLIQENEVVIMLG